MKICTVVLFAGVLALLVLGLLTILGIEANARWDHTVEDGVNSGLFQQQALWACIGLVMMLVVARTGERHWRVLAAPFLIFVIGLLVMVLIPGVGIWVRGTTQLLLLGPIRIQPSALAELAVPLSMAWWLTRDNPDRWWRPVIPIAALALTVVLIGLEPAFGDALLLALVGLVLMLLGGVSRSLLAVVYTCGLCALMWQICNSAERMMRICACFSSHNEVRSLWWPWEALKDAGWSGVGLGRSEMLRFYFDNAPRDFITAVIGEELGWSGLILMMLAYIMVIGAGAYISKKSPDRFGFLLGTGIVSFIGIQVLLNVAAVTGFLSMHAPLLPFVSFGESGLFVDLVAVGVLMNLARRLKCHEAERDS
jgi:cell division protein FtsW